MINVTFRIEQLKINSTQSVSPNQQIVQVVRHILYTSGIDLSDWDNIKCYATCNGIVKDSIQSFIQGEIMDGTNLLIRLSMVIKLEILNIQFPSLEIKVDAFESTQKFKESMIQHHLRNNNYDIIIINGLDGKQIEKDIWVQNGIGNSIPILLNIQTQQKIQWKGEIIDLTFNVFDPIYKIIQKFKTKFAINEIIAVQCLNNHLKPEISYFKHELPLNVIWQATVPNELIFRVHFQKQQIDKQIKCHKDQLINNIIQEQRNGFQFLKKNKLSLKYQWTLDRNATITQEGIPNFSLLKLVEEEIQGGFEISLQSIQQPQFVQTLQINTDTSLEQLRSKIDHYEDQEVIFFLESEKDKKLNPKQKIDDLNIYYGDKILYTIQQKSKQNSKHEKIKQLDSAELEEKNINVLIINLNTVIKIKICDKNDLRALEEVLKYKLRLPSNQLLHFSIGSKIFKGDEKINEILDAKSEYIQVLLSLQINILFKNKNTNQISQIIVNLEDTLRKVGEKLNIKAKFFYNNQELGIDETFVQLKIKNGETIIYDLTATPQEKIENLYQEPVKFMESNKEIIHEASPFNSHAFVNDNQQQKSEHQIKQEDQDVANNTIKVNAAVGERLYKFKVDRNETFENLKNFIFNLAFQGDQYNIKFYTLIYNDIVLKDDQAVSSFNKPEIDIQFKLK